MPARYRLENRHQDEGWEDLGESYADPLRAARAAHDLSLDAIRHGMVRVVDDVEGRVVVAFPAGGPLRDRPGVDVGPEKRPGGIRRLIKGWLTRLADRL